MDLDGEAIILSNIEFFYKYSKLPDNKELKRDIESAATRLYDKLLKFNLKSANLSEYNERYFGDKIKTQKSIVSSLQCYTFILFFALHEVRKEYSEIVFMDYGGGHGMLALLAKELGVGTVIHNDIFPISCEDAKAISSNLKISLDYFIPGDIDTVIEFLKREKITLDAIGNYDVIEHIYDIEDFIKKLRYIPSEHLHLFFASGANSLNPRIRKKLMKQHLEFENEDRKYKYGRKPTDETRALIKVREEIILKNAKNLTDYQLQELIRTTRGLIVDDINRAVENYLISGEYPKEIKHPTNTCDPYTGSWFEHLMNPYELSGLLKDNGFNSEVIAGYYGQNHSFLMNNILNLANLIISKFDSLGLSLSPFYCLKANR
ncbi:MAG: hypothetical protein KF721_09545 [Ignavibacteriaceae bacterium]|nr:hypothetical protein [Ignavibacteriaceae bacterium]